MKSLPTTTLPSLDRLAPVAATLAIRILLALTLLSGVASFAALIEETPTEFLSSGDFNGDGRMDVLVVDKATGNARVGYQTAVGGLTWAAPVPSGVAQVGSVAVGHFIQTNRDALVVTSIEMNRVHIINLSTPGVALTPIITRPAHPGITGLVSLSDPYGVGTPAGTSLDWLAMGSHDPGITFLELFAYLADGTSLLQNQIAAENALESLSGFRRRSGDLTLLAAIQRGSNDTFRAYAYTNKSSPVLSRSQLASGSEYVIGRFNNETFARVLFYVPGHSNIIVQRLVNAQGAIEWGPDSVTAFPTSVQHAYYLDEGTNGLLVVRFGDGSVSGLRPPVGTDGDLQLTPGLALDRTGHVVSLGANKFVLLSGGSNAPVTVQATIFTKGLSGYSEASTSVLPPITSSATRANLWLFGSEPFVNAQPGFIASLNGGGWTTALTPVAGLLRVRSEMDQGTSLGLGKAGTNFLGAPPSGGSFSLANQYHPAISLFSYSAPRAPEASRLTISPAPGAYSKAIQVSFTKANPIDSAFYRLNGNGAWTLFVSPISISNDTTIAYYGQTLSGARGTLQQAAYSIADSKRPPLLNTNATSIAGGDTNSPPANTNANAIQLSLAGTLFYGRQSGSTGSVWAINLDGTSDQFITTGTRPRVSPDGHWMAFTRDGFPFFSLGNLWLRDLVTGEERRLLANGRTTMLYDWFNDSSGLVLDNGCGLYRIDLNGTLVDLPVASDCFDRAPVVNPFDGQLAYGNLNIAPVRGLYHSDASGSTRQRYNLSVAGPAWPAWSPSGNTLSFADVRPGTTVGRDLYTMPANGSEAHQLTGFTDATNGFPFGALWSPDAGALVGAGMVRGVNGLWVLPINAEATACVGNPFRLPTTPGDLIDIAGSIRVGIAPPKLYIRYEPGVAVISWDTHATTFVLESTPELSPGSVWVPIPGPYAVNAGFFEVPVPNPELRDTTFFRLRRP